MTDTNHGAAPQAFDIRGKVILAPMAGITDAVFRDICYRQGADLAFTEMVSAKGLSYSNEKTQNIIEMHPSEGLVGVQIFGHEPHIMAEQAKWIEDRLKDRLAAIDINMGCPARKIVSKGDGSALMRTPSLAHEIVAAVKQAIDKPVSVKFRRGWAQDVETAPEFAKCMEDAGADWICVHGRYAEQLYRGDSCLETIARVKESVSIPVIGNGDIRCAADACRMLTDTKCDSIMVARGAQGNPWIFDDINRALSRSSNDNVGKEGRRSASERIGMAREHARELDAYDGCKLVRMRKHAAWYFHGLPGASFARAKLCRCTTLQDFENVFDEFEDHLTDQDRL